MIKKHVWKNRLGNVLESVVHIKIIYSYFMENKGQILLYQTVMGESKN